MTDYGVQQFILHEFARHAVETENHPIVATNADSGNPHYEPTATGAAPCSPAPSAGASSSATTLSR